LAMLSHPTEVAELIGKAAMGESQH
jgi:hypothetical protein